MSTTHAEASLDIRNVVVPLDGSALAAAALPTARSIAAQFGAGLSTISVAGDERQANELRRHVRDELATDPVVVIADDAAAAISEEVRRRDGALLVMSTRGRGRVSGTILGSVAEEVLGEADAPFIAVGAQAERPSWFTGRPRRRPLRRAKPLEVGAVVALVDGTPSSEEALPDATRWAAALDRELVVLTVAEDGLARLDGTTPNRFGPEHPQAYVDAIADRLRAALPDVRSEVVRDALGVPSGVRSYLSAHRTALLVLGATRRTGLDRLRLGATASGIVRASTVPALIVPVSEGTDAANPRTTR